MDTRDRTKRSLWRDRIATPLRRMFTQGTSPSKIAQCIAFGLFFSVLPFPGFSSLLCAAVAIWLRLNMAAIQAINWLCIGLQIALILPFIRIGAWIWHATPHPLSGPETLGMVRIVPSEFTPTLGWSIVHALTAWVIIAPVVAIIAYWITRAIAVRIARLRNPVPQSGKDGACSD